MFAWFFFPLVFLFCIIDKNSIILSLISYRLFPSIFCWDFYCYCCYSYPGIFKPVFFYISNLFRIKTQNFIFSLFADLEFCQWPTYFVLCKATLPLCSGFGRSRLEVCKLFWFTTLIFKKQIFHKHFFTCYILILLYTTVQYIINIHSFIQLYCVTTMCQALLWALRISSWSWHNNK